MYQFNREEYEKRMEWYRDARFGMFIHWGLYSIPARGEWIRSTEEMTIEEYQKYFEEFDARDFKPREWARMAKQAGMKYMVLTAKHHDGFCLFDSKYTEYKATNTKAGRDLVKEYVEAVRAEGLKLTARPGDAYIEANGRTLYAKDGVHLKAGRTLVPVRVLAEALGATVDWNPATGVVSVNGGGSATTQPDYNREDKPYWLSRIISAESRGEPLEGQIAVGNVVLNRVDSPDFPDTIYGVIFDDRWGGQFTPVRNGTIYQEPTEQSIQAAKLCLEGVNVAKDSLYFLAPALTNNHWIMENRTHVMTIGAHWFYR